MVISRPVLESMGDKTTLSRKTALWEPKMDLAEALY